MFRVKYVATLLLLVCFTTGMLAMTVIGYMVCSRTYENQKTWIKVDGVLERTKYWEGDWERDMSGSQHRNSGYRAMYAGNTDGMHYEFWDSGNYDSVEKVPQRMTFYVNPEDTDDYCKEISANTKYYPLLMLIFVVFGIYGTVQVFKCRP